MTKFPEAEVDQLYQLPLSAFTAARNALAKTLKGAEAQRIKQLAKPTVVPWTVNQLYWHARPIHDRVAASGRALRDAQIAALKGRAGDVRSATEDHRKAVAEAVREGMALAMKEAAHPPADQLARMLEALSLAKESSNPPGRFTEVIQPSGFEALAGIAPPAAAHQPSRPAAGTPAPRPPGPRLVTSAPVIPKPDPAEQRRRAAADRREAAAARRREKEQAAVLARAEAAVRSAERELAAARETLHRAERAADDARRAVQEAERKLATARDSAVLSSPHV